MVTRKLQVDRIRAELDQLGGEIDRLKTKAEQAGADKALRFREYLGTLEKKTKDVVARLDKLENQGADALVDIRNGVREAKQRLAIARQAARARFH